MAEVWWRRCWWWWEVALLGVQIRWMGVGAGVGRVLVLVLVLVPPLWCCLLVGTHLELQALLHFVHVDGDTDEKYLGNVVSAAAVVVAVVAAVGVVVAAAVAVKVLRESEDA